MIRRTLIAALILALTGCSTVASGPSPIAQAPTYQVGDTWTMSNPRSGVGNRNVVSHVIDIQDDGEVIFTGGLGYVGGAPRYRWKDGAVEEVGTRERDIAQRFVVLAGSGWQFLSFPLEVGKSWQFTKVGYSYGRAHQFTVACRVWPHDDIQTKAGTFKAFRMTVEWAGQTPEYRLSNLHTFWYAPAVRFMVREQSTNFNWELLSYRVR
jgi:hypothetical protein